jgi:outer membrane protein assembly factor BamB
MARDTRAIYATIRNNRDLCGTGSFAKPALSRHCIEERDREPSGNLKMEELWNFTSFFAPVLSGVAVANGVVYFHSSGVPSVPYAPDAATGQRLAEVSTNGGISGPSVSNGQIYVGTGTLFASGFATPTGIVAIGL